MRSKELNLDCYNTDKITHRYLEVYDPILAPWVGKEIKLLEIGIHKGGHFNCGATISGLVSSLGSILRCRSTLCLESVFRFLREASRINNFYLKSLIKQLQKDLI